MKLVSVQSRENRVVRIVKTPKSGVYEVFKKCLSFWEDVGFSYNLVGQAFYKKKSDALKAAENWLKGAKNE